MVIVTSDTKNFEHKVNFLINHTHSKMSMTLKMSMIFENFRLKNVVFLFVVFSFCKKVFVVLTFYSLREKCPNERSGNNNNNTS